ncbi:MBL fold metallo-hydrolase [Puerhibacterium puerhi]|uniref:MBL fold metallo-hydrolase n=1 Tax=Puerhibacterium puerhi TaxID=2692623 RepID=UPI001359A1A5|nr:MBL fold metallo-hydrolase [Puerhibacterium puerhi]
MTTPAPVTSFASVLRADNPGPMTLDGTRSYVLRAPGAEAAVVVDPGPDEPDHLAALAAAGPVALVLVTHRHADHTDGSPRLRGLTGAPVRAADPAHCHGGDPLVGGDVVEAAGLRIEVLATPGHTADSVSFVVAPASGPRASGAPDAPVVLTGDTVLGRGTTVIAEPDGSLRDYLASLDALERLATGGVPVRGLPGHGPVVDDLGAVVRAYRAHRQERLAQVRAAVAALGVVLPTPAQASAGAPGDLPPGVPDDLADAVVDAVYADVDGSVRAAARQSVVAQLEYLAGR